MASKQASSEFAPARFNVFYPDGMLYRDAEGRGEFPAAQAGQLAIQVGGQVEPASGCAAEVDANIRAATIQTPTAECGHCGKNIRQNSAGIWGARKRDDPHPWYCDDAPDNRHEPGRDGS